MASPNKNMKTGKYNHSFEGGYIPYKMLGHELPGPNQRTPNKMSMEKTHINDKMVDGVSKKSGVLYNKDSGVESSPATFGLMGAVGSLFGGGKKSGNGMFGGIDAKKIMEDAKAAKLKKQQGAFAAMSGGNDLESRVSALEAGGGGGEGNAVLASGGQANGTAMNKVMKKKRLGGVEGGTGLSGNTNSTGFDPILGDLSQYS